MRLPMLGIDVAKATLECHLLLTTGMSRVSVPNTAAGGERLLAWLCRQRVAVDTLHVCLEATGGYELLIATRLHEAGATVHVINPYRVKRWIESELVRTKTDRVDAGCLAQFGARAAQLARWQPVAPAYRDLQHLVRQRAAVQETITAYANRQQAPGQTPAVQASCATVLEVLRAEVDRLELQIEERLTSTAEIQQAAALACSIIGIGTVTAAVLLGTFGDCTHLASGKAAVALAGLAVRQTESGTSVHGRPRLAKQGHSAVRAALYWPAITAMRHDPHLRAFAERLEARGKAKLQIICAVMRKLVERFYAVLHSGRPYDRQYRSPLAARHQDGTHARPTVPDVLHSCCAIGG
jgi:transposase